MKLYTEFISDQTVIISFCISMKNKDFYCFLRRVKYTTHSGGTQKQNNIQAKLNFQVYLISRHQFQYFSYSCFLKLKVSPLYAILNHVYFYPLLPQTKLEPGNNFLSLSMKLLSVNLLSLSMKLLSVTIRMNPPEQNFYVVLSVFHILPNQILLAHFLRRATLILDSERMEKIYDYCPFKYQNI